MESRNERILQQVKFFVQFLDDAGWCVAVSLPAEDFYLGRRAELFLSARGGLPKNWREMQVLADGFSEDRLKWKSSFALIWNDERADEKKSLPFRLTRRETEVMDWLCRGKTSGEIAIILHCAPRTVEKHVANAYRKMRIGNRTAAILGHYLEAGDEAVS